MLYTDSDLLTPADLVALDPESTLVADAEGITLDGAGGIIAEGWQDCADELLTRMDAFGGGTLYSIDPASYTVGYGGVIGASRSRVFLSQIVASDAYGNKLSTLQRWMQSRALMLFYLAAGNRAASDRYSAKAEMYAAQAKQRWLRLATAGLPIVAAPLPCPGSLHERGAVGSLAVSAVAGGSAPAAASYDVAITYVSADNVESGPSQVASITVAAAQFLRIDITALAWPATAYASGRAQGTLTVKTPAGWKLYVGAAGSGALYCQTLVALPIATKTYTLAAAPLLAGALATPGQTPDYNLAFQATLQRA